MEWSKKLGSKVSILLYLDLFLIESKFLVWCICTKLHAFIVSLFLQFLDIKRVLLANWHQFPQLLYRVIDRVEFWVKINFIVKKHGRIIVIVKLKMRIAGTSIFSVVIYKFRHEQEPCLVLLHLIDKKIRISFDSAILPLGLAVCLWMKSSIKHLLIVKELISQKLEFWGK